MVYCGLGALNMLWVWFMCTTVQEVFIYYVLALYCLINIGTIIIIMFSVASARVQNLLLLSVLFNPCHVVCVHVRIAQIEELGGLHCVVCVVYRPWSIGPSCSNV